MNLNADCDEPHCSEVRTRALGCVLGLLRVYGPPVCALHKGAWLRVIGS